MAEILTILRGETVMMVEIKHGEYGTSIAIDDGKMAIIVEHAIPAFLQLFLDRLNNQPDSTEKKRARDLLVAELEKKRRVEKKVWNNGL